MTAADTLARDARPEVRPAIVVLGLVLAVIAVYAPALEHGFVNFDDPLYVDHPRVRQGLSFENVGWAFTHFAAFNWHPLTIVSHMADRSLFGAAPRGHHLTSVLLHAVNVVLLFAVLRFATGAPGRSLAVAALWGLHPLRVESVAWIAERKDVLCGIFWLLAIAAHVAYARQPSLRRYLLVGLGVAAALLAKPMAVTLPGVLLLLDVWPLERFAIPPTSRRLRHLALEKLPWLALAAGVAWATIAAQDEVVGGGSGIPLGDRLGTAVRAVAAYVGQTLLPVRLAAYYPYRFEVSALETLLAASFLVAASAGAWALRRRAPAVLVGWLWFIGTLVPVSGLLQVGAQARADRYTYLPAIGLAVALVWAVPSGWLAAPARRRAAALALAVAILVLGVLTRRQVAVWRDSVTLFRHTLAAAGPSLVATGNLADGLASDGRHAEAEPYWRQAVALAPMHAPPRKGLALTLLALGRADEAWRELEVALRLAPGDPGVQRAAARVRDALGDDAAAEAYLRRALVADPDPAEVHVELAGLLAHRGDVAAARAELRAAAGDAASDAEVDAWLAVVIEEMPRRRREGGE